MSELDQDPFAVDDQAEVGVDEEPRQETFMDRLRGGVGTEDPNIVGDAGPVDVAPGTDGPAAGGLIVEGPDDHVEV